MNGAVIVARLLRDSAHGSITLIYAGDPRADVGGAKWRAVLHGDTTSHDSLVLQGQLNGHAVSLWLRRSTIQFALEPYETHWFLRGRRDF
jgi:hypothetical protein